MGYISATQLNVSSDITCIMQYTEPNYLGWGKADPLMYYWGGGVLDPAPLIYSTVYRLAEISLLIHDFKLVSHAKLSYAERERERERESSGMFVIL